METPPAVSAAGGAETLAAAAAEEKRARKRSRYLSSDYDTAILNDDDIAASPRKGEDEDAAALLLRLQGAKVATADLLADLLRSAASPCDCISPGPEAGVLIRFFALHRASVLATNCADPAATDHHHSEDSATAPAGIGNRHGLPKPNTCGAMAVADGSTGKKQAHDIAIEHADAAHHAAPANPAAPPEEAERKRKKKKVTCALDGAAVAGSSAQPATSTADGTNSAPKKVKKKARRSSVQGQHPGKPVALLLDFARGGTSDPPSKEELISTFRGFGFLIESETDIGTRRARLVFQSSAAAEAAYSCAHTLGTFTARRLQYLRPPPPPAPKIPLTDVMKNLEKMISSLTGPSVLGREGALDLAREMLRLMASR
jgi:hypothetical protein